jgi:hypothetical protein
MSKKDDFYIGWQAEMSKENSSFLKKYLIPLFIAIPILVFAFVFFQKPFNKHLFEFGKTSEITGIYTNDPYPMLIADAGSLPAGLDNEILLVGYGKFGARGAMNAIQEESGDLHQKKITLQGTLIHGDGKTLMELTESEASLIEIVDPSIIALPPMVNSSNPIQVNGEILDPKCYFGVMKPGEGQIHKSCAIRCISGGIPPVFRQGNGMSNEPYTYYLMLSQDGKEVNEAVLPFVAEQVSLTGNAAKFSGWDILYVNVKEISMKKF